MSSAVLPGRLHVKLVPGFDLDIAQLLMVQELLASIEEEHVVRGQFGVFFAGCLEVLDRPVWGPGHVEPISYYVSLLCCFAISLVHLTWFSFVHSYSLGYDI